VTRDSWFFQTSQPGFQCAAKRVDQLSYGITQRVHGFKIGPLDAAKIKLKSMKYLVSSSSPREICKDRSSSLVVPRPNPSAILAVTDADDRLT